MNYSVVTYPEATDTMVPALEIPRVKPGRLDAASVVEDIVHSKDWRDELITKLPDSGATARVVLAPDVLWVETSVLDAASVDEGNDPRKEGLGDLLPK